MLHVAYHHIIPKYIVSAYRLTVLDRLSRHLSLG